MVLNCAAINCTNNSKAKVRTFKLPDDPKLRNQWLVKMKRAERWSLDSAFKLRRIYLKENAVPKSFLSRQENTAKNARQRTDILLAETSLLFVQGFCIFLNITRTSKNLCFMIIVTRGLFCFLTCIKLQFTKHMK